MSQSNVEKLIGRLVTDEGFRRRFAEDPQAVLTQVIESGLELNPCERRALTSLDAGQVARFADSLDPCIQKIELLGDKP